MDSAEGADAHLHRHYDDENHTKSRFTPLTGLIPVYPTTAEERRFAKALRIAECAASWTTLRADAGAVLYRIPSQSEPGVVYGEAGQDFLERGPEGGRVRHPFRRERQRCAKQQDAEVRVLADSGPGGLDSAKDAATDGLALCGDWVVVEADGGSRAGHGVTPMRVGSRGGPGGPSSGFRFRRLV